MKKLFYLSVAILCNAVGIGLMTKSEMGMTVWGSSAFSVSEYFSISLGLSFFIISVIFYLAGAVIVKRINFFKMLQSFVFAILYGLLLDQLLLLTSDILVSSLVMRLIVNVSGLLILLFGITIHIRLGIAVHPMDVYLYSLHESTGSVKKGTYIAYFSAFSIVIIFSLLSGRILGVGVGTILTLAFGGMIMYYMDKLVTKITNL